MVKIEIKNRRTGEVIYSHECEDNTIRETVEQALKSSVNLSFANLRFADLRSANLRSADLRSADLSFADLRYADLSFADLSSADLNEDTKIGFVPLACPSDGAFVGWKKIGGKLVKLLIPEDARRSSATTNKCRCDKAQVLAITDTDGNNPIDKITNYDYEPCDYIVGETVIPDSFDENRWNECSNGIHFFINKQEAINY